MNMQRCKMESAYADDILCERFQKAELTSVHVENMKFEFYSKRKNIEIIF